MTYRVGESMGLPINDELWVDLWFEVEVYVSGRPGSSDYDDPVCAEPQDYRCTELTIHNQDSGRDVLTLRGKMADDAWHAWEQTWTLAQQRIEIMLERAGETAAERYCDDWWNERQERGWYRCR